MRGEVRTILIRDNPWLENEKALEAWLGSRLPAHYIQRKVVTLHRSRWLGRPGITRSARSFVDAYAPTAFLVVNRGIEAGQDIGKTAVRWIRPHQLASSLAELLGGEGPYTPGR